MKNQLSEFIWDGRLHLGDEPGIYGAAAYVGLETNLPLTLTPMPGHAGPVQIKIRVEVEEVQTYASYPGHTVEAIAYVGTPDTTYQTQVIAKEFLKGSPTSVDLICNALAQSSVGYFIRPQRRRVPGTDDPVERRCYAESSIEAPDAQSLRSRSGYQRAATAWSPCGKGRFGDPPP